MARQPVLTKAFDNATCSVVSLNGLSHVFVTAEPHRGDTLRQQLNSALTTVKAIMSAQGGPDIVQETLFLADDRLIAESQQIVREFYGTALPSVSYVPQPPCSGKLVVVEALGLKGDGPIRRISDQFVVARHQGIDFIFASQAVPRTSAAGVYEQSTCTFHHLRRLVGEGAKFSHMIRAWFYLGGIVDAEGPSQRYKEFNRARTDFYQGVHFLTDLVPPGHDEKNGQNYPASTGIGTAGHGIYMSAMALSSERSDILAVPLQNPRQVAACDYGVAYGPQSPKFARALALTWDRDTIIFISGTASITLEETRHTENIRAQVNETLDNINTLISEENLNQHGLPGCGTELAGLGLLRVYVKRAEDFATVRQACEARVGRIPTIYTVADVCRPDLLVEIEGIAFAHNASVSRIQRQTANGNGTHFPRCPETCQERFQCPNAYDSV